MQINPTVKLAVGGPVVVTIPKYSGSYQVERYGDVIGLYAKTECTELVSARFMVLLEGEVLQHKGRHHGGVVLPYFGWCDVYELD